MIYEFFCKLRYPLFLTSDIYLRIYNYSNIKFLSNYKINARESNWIPRRSRYRSLHSKISQSSENKGSGSSDFRNDSS